MALIDFLSDFNIIKKQIQADELGTHTEQYNKVGTIKAAVTTTSSKAGQRDEQPAPASSFTLTTFKDANITFNDVVQDTETGVFYEIVSDHKQTPKSAGLKIKQFEVRKTNINMI